MKRVNRNSPGSSRALSKQGARQGVDGDAALEWEYRAYRAIGALAASRSQPLRVGLTYGAPPALR